MAETYSTSKIKLLFGLWLLIAALLVLSRWLFQASDAGVLSTALALSLPIASLLFWRRRLRRRAWLGLYLNPRSCWNKPLRGGIWMFLGRTFVAFVLALLLLAGLIRANHSVFWLLVVALVPIWVISYGQISSYVARHVSTGFHRLVTDRIHSALHASALILLLSLWSLYQPVPDLTDLSLTDAILRSASSEHVESDTLYAGLVLTGALEAVPIWAAQNFGAGPIGPLWKLVIWLLILLREWLFVWPLVLVLQALQALLDGGLIRRVKGARDEGREPTAES